MPQPEGAINRLLRRQIPWYIKLGMKLGLLAPPAHQGPRSPEADAELIEAFILAGNQIYKGAPHDTPSDTDTRGNS